MKKREASVQVPVREAFVLNRRALKLWWDNCPAVFVSTVLSAVMDAILPYVGIWFSARLIDELAGARRVEVLVQWALLSMAVTAVVSLLKYLLTRWKNGLWEAAYYLQEKFLTDKLLTMDFEVVNDSHTQDLLSQNRQNRQWGGWGLGKLIGQVEAFALAASQIVGAVALTYSLFALRVPETAGGFTVLNAPLLNLACVALLALVALSAPALSNKAGMYWAKGAPDAKRGNRVFSFYGFMGYERKRALDIRMYRQDRICRKNLMTENPWGPQGAFARYARGPMGLYHALSAAVSHVFTGLVYLFVCLKAWAGAFGVGAVTQYVSAILALSGGVARLVSTLGDMRNNAAFLRDAFAFLDIPNRMYQGTLTVEKRADRQYDIEFRDVSFRYPGAETWALRHVNMKFRVGRRLAVVGRNGSGKTTFIKLLCRLYDPQEGVILLNGIDIRKYGYGEYLSIFSVVFQDFQLLAFPLGQNVAASADPNAARARESLQKAGFGARLDTLPKGLSTCLYRDFDKEGVEISGGEAQKIAIARALYKDAAFIILDEPTAALDPVAESEVYRKFDEIVGDRTAVYISHRLSSCRFCDEIAVFEQGCIVQQGAHEELLAQEGGQYRALWTAQAQYYAEEEAGA